MYGSCVSCVQSVKIPVNNFCDYGNSCISDSFSVFLETFFVI